MHNCKGWASSPLQMLSHSMLGYESLWARMVLVDALDALQQGQCHQSISTVQHAYKHRCQACLGQLSLHQAPLHQQERACGASMSPSWHAAQPQCTDKTWKAQSPRQAVQN